MAITKATEEGAQAVICASTGNTCASAAAYAVRAGMVCAVLVPAGQDRARQDGPGPGARRADAPGRRQLRRLPAPWPATSPRTTRWRWSTASTRSASRVRRPLPSRSWTRSATPPTSTCCRSATRATSRPTGRATWSTPPTAPPRARPRMWGFQAAGCRADRARRARREAVDHRDRHPHRQPRLVAVRGRRARRVGRRYRRGHRP